MLGQIAKWGAKLGAKALFKEGLSKRLKELSSKLGKKLRDQRIKHPHPELYKLGISKTKNKRQRLRRGNSLVKYT